jgi:hypothetical protein
VTTTETYSTIHRALTDTALLHGLTRTEMRVVVALADRGGRSRTDEITADLCLGSGSAVRRAIAELRRRGQVAPARTELKLSAAGRTAHRAFVRSLKGARHGVV